MEMIIMRYEHIRRADLNLLQTLVVLLEEKHVSKAAERCFLSQPAMSRALERLRETFNDELLVRHRGGYERTRRGDRLLKELGSVLARLESLLQGDSFDPALCEERFKVAMTDHASFVVLPQLVERIGSVAPKARLEIAAWGDTRFADLESGKLDLVLDMFGAPKNLESQVLYDDHFVCVVAASHPLRSRRVSLERYLKYPHILVNVLSGQQTPVDRPLAALGKTRPVGLTMPYFGPAVLALARTNMILTIPNRMALKLAKGPAFRTMLAPSVFKRFRYEMIWHPRLNADPVHKWFRNQVLAAA
jgi:DNA-binding transcriptional LysR family regulator